MLPPYSALLPLLSLYGGVWRLWRPSGIFWGTDLPVLFRQKCGEIVTTNLNIMFAISRLTCLSNPVPQDAPTFFPLATN